MSETTELLNVAKFQVGSEERRAFQRSANAERRKKKRQQLLDSKRTCPEGGGEEQHDGDETFTIAQARILASSFHKGSPADRLHQLKMLKRMMGMDLSFIEAFLSVNNSMQALVGQLTGSDASIQVEAAGCVANISAGTTTHCDIALKQAAVYLISFLHGQNITLKDNCSWALGNMAANGASSQEILQRLGLITPLINIIMTSTYAVNLTQSALFALANLLKNDKICFSFPSVNEEFIARLLHFSQNQMTADGVSSGIRLDVCRLLFHLSARQDNHAVMLSTGVFTHLTELLVEYVRQASDGYISIITPLIRCLGNLGCQNHVSITMVITQDDHFVRTLLQLLQTETMPFYLQKEILWTICNLTATSPSMSIQCVEHKLHIFLVQRLLTKPPDIQKESIICVNHLLSSSPAGIIAQLIGVGLVQHISELLRRLEEPTLQSLNLLDNILSHSPEVRPICEENDITSILESLLLGGDDEVRQRAEEITETHWRGQP